MRTFSTKEVAQIVGINRVTLQRWLIVGGISEPQRIKQGGVDLRLWTEDDIDRVRKYKVMHYGKGRGRKKAPKKNGNR